MTIDRYTVGRTEWHRHRWNTRGASHEGTVRTCQDCGEQQRKVRGRWTPEKRVAP